MLSLAFKPHLCVAKQGYPREHLQEECLEMRLTHSTKLAQAAPRTDQYQWIKEFGYKILEDYKTIKA